VNSLGVPLGSQSVQPFPFTCEGGNDPHCTDTDHSNLFQNLGSFAVACPESDYKLWKQIATSGIRGAHYYQYESRGNFRSPGDSGFPLVTPEAATSGRTGFFFFDTADGIPPTDSDGDGAFENLTEEVIFGPGWNSGGFIFLNAERVSTHAMGGGPVARPMHAPAEPYIEGNGIEGWQSGETLLRLGYPLGDPTSGNATFTVLATATTGRAPRGPDLAGPVQMSGVLYNSGFWSAQGNGKFFGSIITRQGVAEGEGSGRLDIWFDGCLQEGCWPPPGSNLPRVVPTSWENDM
jgi:hypothetical protein